MITAQHRKENLQEVPISIAAFIANTLVQTEIDATTGLSQIVPSIQFTRSGPSGLFYVRGVGTQNGAVNEEGSSDLYIDGVYTKVFEGIVGFFKEDVKFGPNEHLINDDRVVILSRVAGALKKSGTKIRHAAGRSLEAR
ncbi:MAG: hypothetical protein R3E09_13440 [Novosphingobium sp.]